MDISLCVCALMFMAMFVLFYPPFACYIVFALIFKDNAFNARFIVCACIEIEDNEKKRVVF